MPTKNAPYYSCKAGRPETLKSHRQRHAAMKAAGEMGQIWITADNRQRQVHESSSGGWMTAEPEKFLAVDLKPLLLEEGMIEDGKPS
ncbi:hypothetical protein [Modicisalibacter sp. MOD 31.J]|uniref:hypothetical protein n=1 Tax=Modicisalibacter sp. MOD 31.J TaxID=2831897 RepID=UPI001CCD3284|nr:hypothetical protein [Modicisalibacter sp. MOD 31.J]MBZ9574560.1 hypothetical protein [Modicisalibacter sp. MOD 31.J]